MAREFFGEDVSTAIKSLPAEAVDRIEVYQQAERQRRIFGVWTTAKAMQGHQHRHAREHAPRTVRQALRHGRLRRRHPHRVAIQGTMRAATSISSTATAASRSLALFNNVNQQNFVRGHPRRDGRPRAEVPGGGRGAWQYTTRPQAAWPASMPSV